MRVRSRHTYSQSSARQARRKGSSEQIIGPLVCGMCIYFILVAAVMSGMIQFTSWGQVELLHNARVELALLADHPHFYRYLTARPGLMLADRMGDVGFSLYILHFAIGSMGLMYFLVRRQPAMVGILAITVIFAIHMLMNGRGVISWLGWMIIITVMFEMRNIKSIIILPILLLALLFTSVSSGTLSVAFGAVLAFLGVEAFRQRKLAYVIVMAVVIGLFTGLFFEGLERNLSYYTLGTRNPLLNMLRHGAGEIIIEHPVIVVIGLTGVTLFFGLIWLLLKRKPDLRELIVTLTPLAGGIFGYTTLTLLIPSLATVVARRMQAPGKRQWKRRTANVTRLEVQTARV